MTALGLKRTLTKLKKLSAEQEHWAAVQERTDEVSLYFDKFDVWNEGLEKGLVQCIEKCIVQGIEKGRAEERLKAEVTWRCRDCGPYGNRSRLHPQSIGGECRKDCKADLAAAALRHGTPMHPR